MPNNFRPAPLKKRIPALLAAILTLVFFVFAVRHSDLADSGFWSRVEWAWVDMKFVIRGPRAAGKEVVIVALDGKSLDTLGSARVFQRTQFAKLVTKLAGGQPKVIGFDIVFSDDDVSNKDNDRIFAEAIEAANSDGKLRHQPQIIEFGGRLYPSLVGSNRIPTGPFGRILIDYTGPEGTYPTVPMIDVLEDRVNRDVFKDKIVLIGATAIGVKDVVSTPFDPALSGVELHANVIENILIQRVIYRRPLEGFIDLGIILIFGLVLGFLLPKLNVRTSVVCSTLILLGFGLFNYWAFARLHWFLSLIYPGLSLAITSVSLISYKYLVEEREKKPGLLRLGGEKRELSVLFSNIRGFTSFSERMAPTEVVQFLNQYFERMQGIIWKNKGTLDKLIGDAVMCFWGAPLEMKDHALRSVVTALEMVRAVEDLRGVLVLAGGARLDIGIGVNTGQMVVGNMGSPDRLSYTVIGDNVNLGSRLKSMNKYYGTKIIIADSTYEEVREMVFCRHLDTIQVKGKTHAVTIFEPLGLRRLEFDRRSNEDRRGRPTIKNRLIQLFVQLWYGERRQEERRVGSSQLFVTPEQEEIKTMYEHALALYRKGDFDGAETGFDHVLSLNPNDGPSRLMKHRIAKHRAEFAGAQTRFDPVYRFDEE